MDTGRIVIAGGSGFLGRALAVALRGVGYRVVVLSRSPRAEGEVPWPDESTLGASTPRSDNPLDGAIAVVNLAGTSIASGRWTASRKKAILESRISATRTLVRAIGAARVRPQVFLSGSAIGYYGLRDDAPLAEDAPRGQDFLSDVCVDWEQAAVAAQASTRVVLLRTGLVLARDGGALPKLVMPFRLLMGGPAGSGRQYVSWIHRDDWVAMTVWAMTTPSVSGPLNLTAPEPVTNAALARALGHVLHRPAWIPTPGFALRLALGEMADALILGGQRVLPRVATSGGFQFTHPTLDAALGDLYRSATSNAAGCSPRSP
jgi:uncharacterized protein (TIGR01777 family)